MKVVLDAVFNHTGSDSKYFNRFGTYPTLGAYQSFESPYYDFFRKRYDRRTDKTYFDYWWGMDNLPVCDGTSPAWINYITGEGGIIDQWFALGIDGLRLDVADELSDYYIEQIKTAVLRNKEDGFIVGEVWENFMRKNREYISGAKGMHATMNYVLTDALIRYFKYADTEKLYWTITDILTEYPEETIYALMNSTSTHDISRPLTIFGSYSEFRENSEWVWDPIRKEDRAYCEDFKLTEEEYEMAKNTYESYLATLGFLPGTLTIFYGDEIGVEGLGNLSNRKPYPWSNIDQDILEVTTSIGKIRLTETFLESAKLNILRLDNNHFMFERLGENEKILFAVNRKNNTCPLELPEEYENGQVVYTLKKSTKKTLTPHGAIAIKNSSQ